MYRHHWSLINMSWSFTVYSCSSGDEEIKAAMLSINDEYLTMYKVAGSLTVHFFGS
jgi:hypothetical protein